MPREKDLKKIPTAFRKFIKDQEWPVGESRSFFYTGYEIVTKTSQKTGKQYEQYFFYLLPIDEKGVGEELTLAVFSNQAAFFQVSGAEDYQEISVKKVQGEKGVDYKVTAKKNILPEDQRPKESEYGEYKQYTAAAPIRPPRPGESGEEINIEDIPF